MGDDGRSDARGPSVRRRALLAGALAAGCGGAGLVASLAASSGGAGTAALTGGPPTGAPGSAVTGPGSVTGGPGATSSPAVASSATAPFSATATRTAAPAVTRTGAGTKGRLVHPGMLHTQADLTRMARRVSSARQPWQAGWQRLTANAHAQFTWKANPQATVYRGSGTPENYGTLYNDVHAAYQNALRWRISGDTRHADTARDILNAWSATLTKVDGTADRFIAAGIYGYQFANAAELIRDYRGFELARFQRMMRRVFYPLSHDFLTGHNGAYLTNYWGSWDLLSVAGVLATGILCDDGSLIDEAVRYFRSGAGNGSLPNAIPVVYADGTAQWVEAGRDQGHATLAVGLMGTVCEMAWNQGIDLYGALNNRFLHGAEYVAKFNLGKDVPYTTYVWHKGAPGVWSGTETFTQASTAGRGDVRPIWELIYQHYAGRRGLRCSNIRAIAARQRPEGGGGDYGPNSGGFDQLGFGTLAFTR
jgi:hypothetical protein